ncbi:MAG: UDP-3-O-(3-hydroxymyristoyl)glucosamine N-acyltransferase [Bacteroidetes bacterium]|nr:UDP-3-O-(3-hydroxymyristoyl)glucosamine N-acyltransferase [Bacteroidota bacterium]MBS1740645.1 UDP-3-O-(3-hydroxymyristoyl)glucosamine N-acyltransferase [Bacteroidota bacterium]MBS1777129.1 UDP-3-O-(3-hydroxymyristoyl)glucosamine N-acyltransferase [Bacteroidota bacterium]
MQFTALQIATLIKGKIEGNPEAKVSHVAKIEEAKDGSLSFIANPKYEEYLYHSSASIIIVNDSLELKESVNPTLIRVKDAYSGFASLLEKYNELIARTGKNGIEQPSYISKKASIGKDVYVGAFSYIGDNVIIGENVKIYPGCYVGDNVVINDNSTLFSGVKVYDGCSIGSRVVVHSGTIIGGDGFGFAPQKDGTYKKVPQIGNVIIEDDVEIGANTTIDRATMGSTCIRKGVKLDNLIQIAHNVEVGENTVIAAQTGISGSTKVGKNCIIGGQVGIVGHIHIADGTRINAQSGLSKSVSSPNAALTGSPAFDYKSSLKSQAIFRNLPELLQRLSKIEEALDELTNAPKTNISVK